MSFSNLIIPLRRTHSPKFHRNYVTVRLPPSMTNLPLRLETRHWRQCLLLPLRRYRLRAPFGHPLLGIQNLHREAGRLQRAQDLLQNGLARPDLNLSMSRITVSNYDAVIHIFPKTGAEIDHANETGSSTDTDSDSWILLLFPSSFCYLLLYAWFIIIELPSWQLMKSVLLYLILCKSDRRFGTQ